MTSPRNRQRERGVALVTIALFMVVLLSFTAVGIDVARLASTATEVQSVADASARGGAIAMGRAGGDEAEGVTRAHYIANKNLMNGGFAQNANVKVDTGFFDPDTRTFECCPNTQGTQTPCCAGSVDMGDWSCGAPTRSCTTRAAVLTMPNTPVQNIFAGVFDFIQDGFLTNTAEAGTPNATTTVEKAAVASPAGPATGCALPEGVSCNASDWQCFCRNGVAPCLPIGVASCEFPVPCFDGPGGCNLPSLTVGGPNSDTAAWTGYQNGHDTPAIRGFLNVPPCGTTAYTPPGEQNVFGDNNEIDLTNGVTGNGPNNPVSMMDCVETNNLGCNIDSEGRITEGPGDVFQIPVFDQTTCSTPASGMTPVVGFATVRLRPVTIAGANSSVRIDTLAHSSATPPTVGGGCFGSDCRITLVQ
jgi:hypothetical protein